MDGIHDLGGRHGFGKIDVNEPEEQFHDPYEARIRSIVNAMSRAPDWNLDWFRHCRELIDPVDYLSRPYFDQWAQTYCAMLINSGWATVEEVSTGKSNGPGPQLPPPMSAEDVRAAVFSAKRFDAPIEAAPAYELGQAVRASTSVPTGHTRLPIYARGRLGRIANHHGAHVFPDGNALNEKNHEHLYTVEFEVMELWPEATDVADTVSLNLWESYLELP
ncbi:MAG: nitrile hydratase subunit beta [Chromatiales bacterium]|jgi:nitrile hydratase subunit beta|nr:nitrile hydratase subunit beta [Chromatiales bacterium]